MRFPQPGELFENRFRIVRELGAGGFSLVLLATDEGVGRPVAIKLVTPDPGGYSAQTRARFEREVRIIARLRHPNTVTLFNYGTSSEGLLYLVFEHVPGEDLDELMDRAGQMDPTTVESILRQLLGALAEAHAEGLVHRDIKPQNVRVESLAPNLVVKLLDFGIARSQDHSHPSITKTGELMGTPRYMSPEQLMDQPLTPASDLYSLGMVAFELLVGKQMSGGNRFTDQIERLKTGHVFEVPGVGATRPELLQVVQRMTARRVQDRFASADAVLLALDGAPQPPARPAAPRGAAPHSTAGHTAEGSTKVGMLGKVAAGLVVAVLVALALVVWLVRPEPAVETVPPPKRSNLTFVRSSPDLHEAPDAGPSDIGSVVSDVDMGSADAGDRLKTASAGCGGRQPGGVNGLLVRQPRDYDDTTPHPVILWFAADLEDPLNVLSSPVFSEFGDQESVLLVAHNRPISWSPSDVRAVEAMVLDLMDEYCVDPQRIFAAASGGGGRVVGELACRPWIAGVTINSQVEDDVPKSACLDPRPALWILPRDSANQPYAGGVNCFQIPKRPFPKTEEEMLDQRGCKGSPKKTYREASGQCRSWDCEIPFEVCVLQGGQGWPGAPRTTASSVGEALGLCPEPAPREFEATKRMWNLFEPLRSPKTLNDYR